MEAAPPGQADSGVPFRGSDLDGVPGQFSGRSEGDACGSCDRFPAPGSGGNAACGLYNPLSPRWSEEILPCSGKTAYNPR